MASVLWRRLDRPGHEYASLRTDGPRPTLSGVALFEHDSQPCRLQYEIVCEASWQTVSADVSGSIGPRDIALRIAVDDRRWTMNGEPQPTVESCIDVDLNFSPSTNLLPIRRLNLAIGEEVAVRAAWLRFPSFKLEPLDQVYRRLSERVFRYQSASFVAEILVGDEGLPLRYGDVWVI